MTVECRYCGCTDRSACPEGCFWAAPEVCSNCIEPAIEELLELIEEEADLEAWPEEQRERWNTIQELWEIHQEQQGGPGGPGQ